MCRIDKKKQAITELQHSFNEWALSASNSRHTKFRAAAIREINFHFDNGSVSDRTGANASTKKFPTDLNAAYRHVLFHDDCPDFVVKYSDRLGMSGGFLEPYRRVYDRNDKSRVIDYKVKQEYKSYTLDQLDPLNRFSFVYVSREETFFREWFLVGDNNDASFCGVFMEAALACYVLQNEKCHSCKYSNALRWNGGGSASWQDLFCTVCRSTYEVKTKATTERVENAFTWNKFQGGSFAKWCQLEMENRKPDQKCYLVVLPRQATYNRKMAKVHPVHIAEIEAVLPKLYPGSFMSSRHHVAFQTTVSVKMSTKEKWFDLPSTGEIETQEIAEKVFVERFSRDTFDTLMENYFHSYECGSDVDTDVEGKNLGMTECEVVEKMNELKLAEAPDDWEDLLSDED